MEYLTEMYEYFCKKYQMHDIDVMMIPRGFNSCTDSSKYEKYLKKIGVKGLSIDIDLFNDEICKKCKHNTV